MKKEMDKIKEEITNKDKTLDEKLKEIGKNQEMLQMETIKFAAIAMKENKWSKDGIGSVPPTISPNNDESSKNIIRQKLEICEDGLTVINYMPSYIYMNCPKYSTNGYWRPTTFVWLSVRADIPIGIFNCESRQLPLVACYFEVEMQNNFGVGIGFCQKEFPLWNQTIGKEKNSVGVWTKEQILINGLEIGLKKFNGKFSKKDVIGCGLTHSTANSPMKYFATCNGEMLGSVELPAEFGSIQLYPTATLYCGESIKANFGKELFLFDATKWNELEK